MAPPSLEADHSQVPFWYHFDRNNRNSICAKELCAHLVFSAALEKELDSTKVIQLVLLGLFWN